MNHPFCFPSFFLIAFVQVALLAPPDLLAGQSSLSLEEVTQKELARNPTVAAARARWRMVRQRIPQEAAWEDPKLSFRSRLGRFVQIPANGFTDQTVSIEQSIHQHLTDYQIALAELEALVGSNLRFFGGVPEGPSK